ncbi:hypothetical protein GCM10011614_08610 [Novosphingobium colocasiae]|uniref:Uncharacterized protein n=1 Tax=Novosphingobium colocasiae TaxID=1256513 RepID=A0A918PAK7_9SPHN|nr:hypothetical protein GCM10011614_08610 [Novosphingobium colocasiae]
MRRTAIPQRTGKRRSYPRGRHLFKCPFAGCGWGKVPPRTDMTVVEDRREADFATLAGSSRAGHLCGDTLRPGGFGFAAT